MRYRFIFDNMKLTKNLAMSLQDHTYAQYERGVGLVELAIALPFFLALVFSVIWASLYFNAKISFTDALPKAVDKALRRGDFSKHQSTLALPLDCYYYYRSDSELLPPFDEGECNALGNQRYWDSIGELLYLNNISPSITDGEIALDYYNSIANYCGTDAQFGDLPRTYLYTLAYLYSLMRKSIGNQVRYPCDPTKPGGEGCISCTFSLPSGYQSTGNCKRHNHISISCTYRANFSFLNPFLSLLNLQHNNLGVFHAEVHS